MLLANFVSESSMFEPVCTGKLYSRAQILRGRQNKYWASNTATCHVSIAGEKLVDIMGIVRTSNTIKGRAQNIGYINWKP